MQLDRTCAVLSRIKQCGVEHHKLEEDNIFLVGEGDSQAVVLIDFDSALGIVDNVL